MKSSSKPSVAVGRRGSMSRRCAAAFAFPLLAMSVAHAATNTWNNTSTDFNAGGSWSLGVVAVTDNATFTGPANVLFQPNLTASRTVTNLTFSSATSAGYVLSASPGFSLTLTGTGTGTGGTSAIFSASTSATSNTISSAVNFATGAVANIVLTETATVGQGSLEISGVISTTTSTGVSLNGTGTNNASAALKLSGANTFAGNFFLGRATLSIANAGALSNGSLVTGNAAASSQFATFDNGAGAALVLNSSANGLIIGNTTIFTGTNSLTFNGTSSIASALTVNGVGGAFLSLAGSTTLTAANTHTINGALVLGALNWGAFQQQKSGNGTLTLNGVGSGTGLTTQSIGGVVYPVVLRTNAGTLEVGNKDAFSSGAVDIRGITLRSNTDLTGANKLNNTFVIATGSPTIGGSNNIEFGGNFVLSNGANNQSITVANTGTTKWSGTLSLTDASGDNQTLTLNVGTNSGATEISGIIQDTTTGFSAGSIVKSGAGYLLFSGASTYTGSTNVQNGTLQLSGSLAFNTSLNLGNGTNSGRFVLGGSLGAVNQSMNRLTTAGTGLANAVVGGNASISMLTVANDNSDDVFSGLLGGAGVNENNLGFTKAGFRSLTLTGNNTYVGPTNVIAGTLFVSGSLNSSAVTVTNGSSLLGTGSVGATTLDNGGNTIGNATAGTAAFTLNALAFGGSAQANIRLAQANATAAGLVVLNALSTTPANGSVNINLSSDTGLWTTGLVNLISFGSFSGSAGDFNLGSISGFTSRQSSGGFVLNGNNLALLINGDSPKWTGLDDGNWAFGLSGINKNWKLITANVATDYAELDTVIFDDSALGTTTIDLGTPVNPSSVTFNNSALTYTFSSALSNGINSGFVIKNGSGTVTINTLNNYTGGTTFKAGRLNLGNAGALGNGSLAINAGGTKNLDNTSGGALTLTTITSQAWNDDFTFIGSNDIDMGNATVVLGGTGGLRTVTVAGSVLTVGRISGAGFSFTKAGAGTLTLNPTAVSNIGGTLTVSAGQLNIGAQDLTATGLAGGGTITNGSGTNRWLIIDNVSNNTFTGILTDGIGAGKLGFSKGGIGTTTLSGSNSYSDLTTLRGGTVIAQNASALGTGTIQFPANSSASLDIALDTGDLANAGFGTNTAVNITVLVDRLTAGAAVNHSLGTAATVNSMGGGSVTIAAGPNVTSGIPLLTLGTIGLAAGSTQTTTFNPTTANVSIAGVVNISNNTHVMELGGSATGTVVGAMTGTTGTLSVLKTGTSAWTLTGANSYNGTTTVSGGILNIGDGGATGTFGAGAVTNNATINFNRSDSLIVTNAIGGTTGILNQVGSGTTTLSGVSGFSGATNILGGKLSVTGSINGSPLALTSGTLDGTGSVGATTVADNALNVVANGNGAAGALTLASLTFAGDATLNIRSTSGAAGLAITGALTTTPANGTLTINATTTTGTWADGSNNLISFGSFSGAIGDFTLGTATGTLGPRQSYGALVVSGNNIALFVNGDTPKWTGALSGEWSTATLAPPKNWKLIGAGTPTDYLQTTVGDNVVFDDSATGTTAINITGSNVSPLSMVFNNNTKNYTIGSSGGFGIAGIGSLTKNGAGDVALSANNSYTGPTTVNRGTLTLSGTNASTVTTVNPAATLRLDFSAAGSPVSNILATASTLVLGGATLRATAQAGSFNTQTVAATIFNNGGSAVIAVADANNNTPLALNLGVISHNTGGAVTFTLPGGNQDSINGVLTSSSNASDILGPWAVVSSPGSANNNDSGGYTFASIGGGSGLNVVPYTGASALSGTSLWTNPGDQTINYDLAWSGTATMGNSRNANTVRFTSTGGTIDQNSTAQLITNGVMNAGTGTMTFNIFLAVATNNGSELVLVAATADMVLAKGINSTAGAVTIMGNRTINFNGALSANSTYTGQTTVAGGTLQVSGTAALTATSGIVINGSNAKYLHTSSVASNRLITVTQGTLDGTGTVGTVTVNGFNGVVTNGNNSAAPLTIGSLTYTGEGKLSPIVNPSNATAPGLIVTSLIASGAAGSVEVDPTPQGIWNFNSNYTLVTYTGVIGGTGFSAFKLGTVNGISTRTPVSLVNGGTSLVLSIGAGAPIVWTGGDDTTWSVGLNGASKNWKLQSTNVATDFLNFDQVVFDDTGANPSINISGAAVNTGGITFNNSSVTYTISGSGIASGAIIKNGAGTVSITTANSYIGGTTLNAGLLIINNSAALGTGALALNGGTLDNTGGPFTLAGNPTQSWGGNFTYLGASDLSLGTGAVAMTGSRVITIVAGKLTVGGIVSGAGFSLTKEGDGTLTLNRSNTYSGGTVVNGGVLELGAGGGAGAVRGNLTINNGATVRALVTDALGFTVGSQVAVLTVNAGGTFDDAATAGNFNQGFTTQFVMNGGTVQSSSGGSINFADPSDGGNPLADPGIQTVSGSTTSLFSAPIAIRDQELTINAASNSILTISGAIGGGAKILNIQGAGTVTLKGSNTYGATNITGGEVRLEEIGSLGSGNVNNAGVLTINGFGTTIAGNISGAGTINQLAGTTLLTGDNSMSGNINIAGGTLQVGNFGTAGSLGSASVLNGDNLTFARADNLTVNGTISGAGAVNHIGSGTTTLAAYQGTGAISVTAGNLGMATTNGARQTSAVMIQPTSLAVSTGAALDIYNHDMMIPNSTYLTIHDAVLNGTGFGDPSGPQITSTTANLNPFLNTTLVPFSADGVLGDGSPGSAIGAQFQSYTDNVIVTAANTTIIKYAYYSDVDFSGNIDGGDLVAVLGNLGATTPGLADMGLSWISGDVDFSGLVDGGDVVQVLGALGTGSGGPNNGPLGGLEAPAAGPSVGTSQVPEPASLMLLGLGAGGMLLRRKRRR